MVSPTGVQHIWGLEIPMRDGVITAADAYLPPAGVDGGPYPVILHRTPYNKLSPLYVDDAEWFALQGYAAVIQDVRGRNDSRGDWYPFFNEGPDGFDSVEWLAAQGWCTGKIGTMGGSYGGWYQWAAARERPPHLTTLVSSCSAGRWMEEVPYRNGMVSLALFSWLNLVGGSAMQDSGLVDWRAVYNHWPLREMDEMMGRAGTVWHDWLDHPTLDEFWEQIRLDDEFANIDVPVLHLTGWYDGDQLGQLFLYEGMRKSSPARDKQHIIVGPWHHQGVRYPNQRMGDIDFTPSALVNMRETHKRWYDYWLRGEENGVMEQAPVRYFLMGINEWRDDAAWPPPATRKQKLYLRSDGTANTFVGGGRLDAEAPTAEEPCDTYVYDPSALDLRETINFYDQSRFRQASEAAISIDARNAEVADDVLAYTSAPLEAPITIVGQPYAVLYASSDRRDTDWVVKLTDVHPDGRSIPVASGYLRARFRESVRTEKLLEPGTVYAFRVELDATGLVVLPGHRLRVTVKSHEFPLYDRNPNTGGPIGADTEPLVATNNIHHGPRRLSRIELPVQ